MHVMVVNIRVLILILGAFFINAKFKKRGTASRTVACRVLLCRGGRFLPFCCYERTEIRKLTNDIFFRYCAVKTVEIIPQNTSRYQPLSVHIVILSIWYVHTDAAVFQDLFNFKICALRNVVTSKCPSSSILRDSGSQ
jgi:hypothetical protein